MAKDIRNASGFQEVSPSIVVQDAPLDPQITGSAPPRANDPSETPDQPLGRPQDLGLRGTVDPTKPVSFAPQQAVVDADDQTVGASTLQPDTQPLQIDIPTLNIPTGEGEDLEVEEYQSVLGNLAEDQSDFQLRDPTVEQLGKINLQADERANQVVPELDGYRSVLGKIYTDAFAENIKKETATERRGMAALVSPGTRTAEQVRSFEQIRVADTPAYAPTEINDLSSTAGKSWNFGTMKGNSLVVHHTAGRGGVDGVVNTFKQRGFPAHFVIDREGNTHQVLGLNQKGRHTRNSKINDVTNSNSWGVEIIAKDDNDVTPQQAAASVRLVKFLNENQGMPLDRIFGHGEINTHKQKTEGSTVVNLLRSQLPTS